MRISLLVILSANIAALPSYGASFEDLVKRNGIYYEVASDTPFSGEIQGQDSGFFKDGQKNGQWIYRHSNGQIKSIGNYQNGHKHGDWLGYYENGQVFYEGAFLRGVREGLWVSFYDDGKVFYRGAYILGKEDGPWVGFNPDGSVWNYRTGHFSKGFKTND